MSTELLIIFHYYLLHVCGNWSGMPFFISVVSNLRLPIPTPLLSSLFPSFSLFLSPLTFSLFLFLSLFGSYASLTRGLSILLRFFWDCLLLFDSLYSFPLFKSIDFSSIFIISFTLLALGLNWSSFSRMLRWTFKCLVLDLPYFLVYAFKSVSFPLSTAFVYPTNFYKLYFSFSFSFFDPGVIQQHVQIPNEKSN